MIKYSTEMAQIKAEKKLLRELQLKEIKACNEARNRELVYSVVHKEEWVGEMEDGICGIWNGFEWIFEGTWEECFAEKHRLEVNYPAENFFLEK